MPTPPTDLREREITAYARRIMRLSREYNPDDFATVARRWAQLLRELLPDASVEELDELTEEFHQLLLLAGEGDEWGTA